jgi:hypothetical protein
MLKPMMLRCRKTPERVRRTAARVVSELIESLVATATR